MHPALRVVLDASAISELCRQNIAVGELIAEVTEENGAVALPTLCLTEAAAHWVADTARLQLLVGNPTCEVIEHDLFAWQPLVGIYRAVGRLDAATAALIALTHRCYLLSAVPALYAGLPGGGPVIPI